MSVSDTTGRRPFALVTGASSGMGLELGSRRNSVRAGAASLLPDRAGASGTAAQAKPRGD